MLRTLFGLIGLPMALMLLHHTSMAAHAPLPFGPGPELTGPPPKIPELPPFGKFSKTPDIIQLLNDEIDTKAFQEPMHLGEALGLISEKFAAQGKSLPLLFDEEAFKAEPPLPKEKMMVLSPGPQPPKKKPALLEMEVKLPAVPKKMTAATALQVLIAQLADYHATYLIRQGTVVITTQKRAAVKSLLQQKVTATFHQKPLFEALFVLSDHTGASIAIDPKVTERMFMPVSATFAHDMTLESALTLLTDMAGLRQVMVGDGIYVTTAENADKLRYLPKN